MLHLLVIENDSDQSDTWTKLDYTSYQVEYANTLEAALKTCQVFTPEIVIVNLLLENENAIKLVIQLKRMIKGARIIGLTASLRFDKFYFGFMKGFAGIDEVLEKPVSTCKFLDLVERIIRAD